MTAAHLSGITNVKKVFRCYNKSYWWFRTITLGPIDCNVCLHTTLLFPIFFTYTPKIAWCRFKWKFNRNSYIFIQENAFQNVIWKMAAVLSRPQYVKLVFIVIICIYSWPRAIHFNDALFYIIRQANGPTPLLVSVNMAAFSQTTFSNAFSWMKILYFDSNFTEVCS